MTLRSPVRKLKTCVDCGKTCTGSRCSACNYKHVNEVYWTPENRCLQSERVKAFLNIPDGELLKGSIWERQEYFRLKYGGVSE